MDFLQYTINGISIGAVYAIIALGYTMVYGITKMLNFAHGDVIMVGAYMCFFAVGSFSLPPAAGVLLAVAVWLAIWLFACNGSSLFDTNAQDGQAPYKTAEEMQAELDRVVEEGMFNISIAGAIQFDDGTSDGIAYIENVPGNRYLMQVRITEDATDEVLYESGVLKPNQFIEKIALTRDLDAGTYPATATFTALDPTSYDEVGQAAAKVTINVAG